MGERRGSHTDFFKGKLMERDHLEDPGLDGRTVLKLISCLTVGRVDWIDLAG
jgi:hypothetical protein